MSEFIPVSEPLLSDTAMQNVADCVSTGWVSSGGKYLDIFEQEWAAYCQMKHGIAVTNGTAALKLAMRALELEPGDEVILPSFTIISCVLAVLEAGATPVLVDCDQHTWCVNVSAIEEKITPKTRAIMVVHMFGHPVDMDPVLSLAKQHNLYIIEDAAEAHGALYKDRIVGSFGHISCFSFYANKLITTGEGGMVLTANDKLANKIRSYRNLAFRPEKRFWHTELGDNYRMTNMQAAIGISQIEALESHIKIKRKMAARYSNAFKQAKLDLILPYEADWAQSVYWMYGIVLPKSHRINAAEFASLLREKGIDTRPLFLGMHQQPVFHDMGLFESERYPITENLAENGLYLPSGLNLTDAQIDRVCESVISILSTI